MVLKCHSQENTATYLSPLGLFINSWVFLWQVGISQPGTTKDGNVVFTEPQSIMHIAADTSLECELTSSLQASAENQSNGTSHHASAEDGEEEEDFLESVTGQQSSGDSGAVSAPLLRVRGAGKEAWESSFALFPSASVLAGKESTLACKGSLQH